MNKNNRSIGYMHIFSQYFSVFSWKKFGDGTVLSVISCLRIRIRMYRIRITMGGRIRICIIVKSWITDPPQSQNSGAVEAQMEPWRAVDAHNEGL